MKSFGMGFLVGGVIGVALFWAFSGDGDFTATATSELEAPVLEELTNSTEGEGGEVSAVADSTPEEPERGVVEASDSLEGGQVWLRVGEAFVFGSGVVGRDAVGRGRGDFFCQDIRHGASLECPHGAAPAVAPLTSTGIPKSARLVAESIPDAPEHLSKRDLMLSEQPQLRQLGVGFVAAASGAAYRLFLVNSEPSPNALQRRVLIGFSRVERRQNGGELRVPQIDGSLSVDGETGRFLRRGHAIGKALQLSFYRNLSGKDFVVANRLGASSAIQDVDLIVKQTVETKVKFSPGRVLVLEKSLARGAAIEGGEGVAIGGDLAGTVKTTEYCFVQVRGHLTGELEHRSYAASVIEGDVLGTLRMRSYCDVLIRGRVFGTIDARGSCWSTLYLESYTSRADLIKMKGDSSVTVHVKSTDLPPGEHEGVGKWRKVIVGSPIWRKLPGG